MRCLTLTQPWASLVMCGAKRMETRDWRTNYRGQLGIHAAKGFPVDAADLCFQPLFKKALVAGGFRVEGLRDRHNSWGLPLGMLLGTVTLVDCVSTVGVALTIDEQERAFGDFTPGRWAWILEDFTPFAQPIPLRGSLRLWTWDQQETEHGN